MARPLVPLARFAGLTLGALVLGLTAPLPDAAAQCPAPPVATAVADGFTLDFCSVDYDVAAVTSTWTYVLSWDGTPPALSHLGLALCETAPVVASAPPVSAAGLDPPTGLFGLKWDSADLTLPQTLRFTLAGLYAVGPVPWAPKAGSGDGQFPGSDWHFGEILGPDLQCLEVECLGDADCADDGVCEVPTCDPASLTCVHVPLICDDRIGCTHDACDPVTDTCAFTPDASYCDDGAWCNGAEWCDPSFGCLDGPAPSCDDAVACTRDDCDEAADACVQLADDALCDDGAWCDGAERCDPLAGCLDGPAPDCTDAHACTFDRCDELFDSCRHFPVDALCDNGAWCDGAEVCNVKAGCLAGVAPDCDDGVACTVDGCDELRDVCRQTPNDALCDNGAWCDGPETCDRRFDCVDGLAPDCSDGVACTVDSCDEDADTCRQTPDDGLCVDDEICTDDRCEPALGCVNPLDLTNDPSCRPTPICRTAGFWATHAGTEKRAAANIVQAVLDAARAPVEVCGQEVLSTALATPDSAVELLCVAVHGNLVLQLARQLTAAKLNCVVSTGYPDCSDATVDLADIAAELAWCDAACLSLDTAGMSQCIGVLDCFNNGGVMLVLDDGHERCVTGVCADDGSACGPSAPCVSGAACDPLPGSCHDQPLCPSDVTGPAITTGETGAPLPCFEPTGPAGSSKACNTATGNDCTLMSCE